MPDKTGLVETRHALSLQMKLIYVFIIIFVLCPGNAGAGDILDIESLNILNLETAQQIALSTSPSIKTAKYRVVQAKEKTTQARSSWFPRIDAGTSGSRIWRSDTALQSLGNPQDPEDRFSLALSGSWTAFNGFQRKFQNLMAEYGHKQSLSAYNESRRLILSSIASGYYYAQLAKENISIAAANKIFNEQQAKYARARQDAGTGSLSDVLNFDIQVNAAKTELIRAKADYKKALSALAALMGIEKAEFPQNLELAELENESSQEFVIPEQEKLTAYALSHRPDILSQIHALSSSGSAVEHAKSGYWPVVSLSGSINAERTDDPGFHIDDIGSSISMNLSYNLFEGGYTKAKVREAAAKKSEQENTLKQTQISVKAQVIRSFESLTASLEQLKLQRANAGLVQQNRDLVEKEYKAGQTSLVRLNEAQKDLVNAQSSLALALVSMRLAWQELKAATGEILEGFGNQ